MSDTSSSRNQRIIDELLADAGMEDAGDLRPVLLELRALAADSPRPSAEVEALMAPGATLTAVPATAVLAISPAPERPAVAPVPEDAFDHASELQPADELAARRRRKRRLPLAAFSVAAALAAGGAAAAASDENFRHAVTVVVGTLTSGTDGKTAGHPSPERAGTVPGSPAPAPTAPEATPGNAASVPGGQNGNTAADPAVPSPATGHTPGHTPPAKPAPRDPARIPDPGRLATGKTLPSSPVSPDPSELIPTTPVELPELPGPSPKP